MENKGFYIVGDDLFRLEESCIVISCPTDKKLEGTLGKTFKDILELDGNLEEFEKQLDSVKNIPLGKCRSFRYNHGKVKLLF